MRFGWLFGWLNRLYARSARQGHEVLPVSLERGFAGVLVVTDASVVPSDRVHLQEGSEIRVGMMLWVADIHGAPDVGGSADPDTWTNTEQVFAAAKRHVMAERRWLEDGTVAVTFAGRDLPDVDDGVMVFDSDTGFVGFGSRKGYESSWPTK